MALTLSSLSYMLGYVAALAALPFLFRRKRNLAAERCLFVVAVVVLVARSACRMMAGMPSWDLATMRAGGEKALGGSDPYDIPIYVFPPSSLALHELWAMAPPMAVHRIWMALNTLMLLALPHVSWRTLADAGPGEESRTGPFPFAAAACILLSLASVYGIDAGQTQLLTTLFILFALRLKYRDCPSLAGLCLAVATAKVAMMLPILTQFCDRRAWRAWIGLAAGVVVLSALGTPIGSLPDRYRANLANIARAGEPGGVNDYTFDNTISDDLVSISRWLYCLGLRDRPAIHHLELAIVGAIWVALAWVTATRRLPPDASAAATCVLGTFFLYHRMYDTVLLAPALVYYLAAARREEGWRRTAFIASTLGLLAAMNVPRGAGFWALARWSLDAGIAGLVVQILVLPYATWCLLGALATLCIASRRDGRAVTDGI